MQSLAACVRFPRDATDRIARLERTQAGEVFVAERMVLRAAGVGARQWWCAFTRRRLGPRNRRVVGMYDRPRTEQAEGMPRCNDEPLERQAPAPHGRNTQVGLRRRRGRYVGGAERRAGSLDFQFERGPRYAREIFQEQAVAHFLADEGGLGLEQSHAQPASVPWQ